MHQIRRAPLIHRGGAIHAQDRLVGVPIGEGVQARGKKEGDHHASRPAQKCADGHEQPGHQGHQKAGPQKIHGAIPRETSSVMYSLALCDQAP